MADWLRKLFGGQPPPPPDDDMYQQAVLVYLPLSDDEFGDEEEREDLFELEDRLIAAIEEAAAGIFDGNEFGGGECVLFMYGPDADRLFAAVEPVLRAYEPARGGWAIKRYGPPDDPDAREERVEL